MSSGSTIVVRRLENPTDEEVERITAVAVDAFANDQFNNFMVGGDATLLPALQRSQIKAGAVGGKLYVAGFGEDDIASFAVWFGPGEELLSSPEQLAAGWNDFMASLPADVQQWWGTYLLPNYGALTTTSLGEGAKRASWHLQLLATAPGLQRRGLARALIGEVEKLAAQSSTSLTLETETQRALSVYKALGFEIRGETHLVSPLGECDMWSLEKKTTGATRTSRCNIS